MILFLSKVFEEKLVSTLWDELILYFEYFP